MGTCSVPGCDGRIRSKGLCVKHYSRLLRHGHTKDTRRYGPGAVCEVAGCSLPVQGRGWCAGHYMRWWRYGDLMPDVPLPGAPSPDVEVRFWTKVDKAGPTPTHAPHLGPCWLWTAASSGGRGIFMQPTRRTGLAHRIAYEWEVGPVPEGLELDHLCRTPLCVRPDHLEPVTHDENMRRAKRITCPQGHLYAEHGRPKKDGSTVCKVCESDRNRRRYAARKAAATA